MSDSQIIRPRLSFEREFGQHRNWWVRGDVLSGNAVKVLLSLLSHDQNHDISQTEAQRNIGLGQSAWRAAKEDLMRAGLLIEVRDRYPSGSRRADGTSCGGQKRYRLVLQDPPEGREVSLEDAIIESESSVDLAYETPGHTRSRFSRAVSEPGLDYQDRHLKAQVTPALDFQERTNLPVDNLQAALDFQEPFIGIEEMGLDGINSSNPIPSSTSTVREQDAIPAEVVAATDARLAGVHPGLSVDSITRQVRGRMNLTGIDLVDACIEILNANQKPGGVKHPAAYVAKSLISDPDRWSAHAPVLGLQALEQELNVPNAGFDDNRSESKCSAGIHDWGPNVWEELSRSHCVRCDARRRDIDPVYRELEDEHSQWLSSRSGS